MERLSEARLAYFAGVIDTRANLTRRTVREDSVLPQVDLNGGPMAVLELLGQLTGVSVVPTRRTYSRAPCTEHCTERHQHIESVSGRWSVSGAKATIVLAAVEPYLILRPAEVQELVEMGLQAAMKGATVEKMAALGWPIPDRLQRRQLGQS